MISWARAILGQTQVITETPSEPTLDIWTEQLEPAPAAKPSALLIPQRTSRAPVAVSLLLLVIAITAFALYARQVQRADHLHEALAASQQQVTRLTSENAGLTQQLTILQRERSELDERVFALGTQLSAAMAEVERAKQRLIESEQLTKRWNEARVAYEAQMTTLLTQREAAQDEAGQLRQEKASLERSTTRMRARMEMLERDYQKLTAQMMVTPAAAPPNPSVADARVPTRSSATASAPSEIVELSPVVVPSQPPARPAGVIPARVVSVNEAQRFVIIDRGALHGVHEGTRFQIQRAGAPVGEVTVMTLRPKLSACTLSPTTEPKQVRVGDDAIQERS